MRLSMSVLFTLILCQVAGGQLAKTVVAGPDGCAIARPWAKPGGELLSPKTASATYQALEQRASVDSTATLRDVSGLLARNPNLLGAMSSAAQSCPKSGCACPKLPSLAQTAQMGQALNLASSYRYDSAGTAAGTAVFLSRHLWLVTRLRDSLARSGTAAQRNSLTKSAAARAATAIKR